MEINNVKSINKFQNIHILNHHSDYTNASLKE